MRSFVDPELEKEYRIEYAKAAARIDFAVNDELSRRRDRELIRKQFQYSILAGLFGACVGFWLGFFSRLAG